MECPFCHINSDDREEVIFSNSHCLFLQEPQDVLIGSGIIIPKEHRTTVFELTDEEWNASYQLLKQARKLLDKKYHADGYNVGWNNGATAGQEIFHAHMHVIPRFNDEPLAGKGIRYWIKQPSNKRE